MKLQRQLSRKVGSKTYVKYVIAISSSYVEKLGWKQGEDLEVRVNGREAKIRPKK